MMVSVHIILEENHQWMRGKVNKTKREQGAGGDGGCYRNMVMSVGM